MPVQLFDPPQFINPGISFMQGYDSGLDNDNTRAKTALANAQAKMAEAEIPFLPTKYQAQLMGSQGRMIGSINSLANSFKSYLDTPAGQAALKANPSLAQTYSNILNQQSNFMNQGGYGLTAPALYMSGLPTAARPPALAITQGNMPQTMGQTPQPLPLSASQIQNLKTAEQGAGISPTQQGLTINPGNLSGQYHSLSDSSSDSNSNQETGDSVVDSIQDTNNSKVIKDNIATKTEPLLAAGARFNASLNMARNLLDIKDKNGEQIGASRYIGPIGQLLYAQELLDAHQTGKTNPSIVNYQNFERNLEAAKAQGAQLENVPADQKSRGQFNTILDFHPILDTVDTVRFRMDNALRMAQNAEVSNAKSLCKLSSETPKEINTEPVTQSTASTGSTAPQNQSTQQNTGEITIPTFPTNDKRIGRQMFLKWFNSQPVEIQRAVRQKMNAQKGAS